MNDFSDVEQALKQNGDKSEHVGLPTALGRRAAALLRDLVTLEAQVLDGEDATDLAAPLVAKLSQRSVTDFISAPTVTVSAASEKVAELYPSPDMQGNNRALSNLALIFFGDAPVSTLTKDKQTAFFNWIARLPKHHGRSHGKNRFSDAGEHLRLSKNEEIQRADERDARCKAEIDAIPGLSLAEKRARLSSMLTPRLTLTTLKRYCYGMGRLFRAANALGNPDTPEAISYRDIERSVKAQSAGPLGMRVTKSKTRLPWTEERLAKFLTSPVYTGCKSPKRRWQPGKHIIRDGFYWVPLIVMTLGTRVKEVLLLKRSNVRLRNGVYCLALSQDPDQSGKTKSAQRFVPIPQTLLDLGFVDWVKERPEDHDVLLFPEAVARARTIDVVSPFSKSLHRGFKAMGIGDFDEDFYALRKTFQTILNAENVTDGERQALAGHRSGSIINRHYTAHHTKKLKLAVDKADFALTIEHDPQLGFPVIKSCNLVQGAVFAVDATLAEDYLVQSLIVTDPISNEVLFTFESTCKRTGTRKPQVAIIKAAQQFHAIVGEGTLQVPSDTNKTAAIEAFHALA